MKKALKAVLLLLLLVVVFLPALAGTAAGAKFLSGKASAGIPGTVEISGTRFSWGTGQEIGRVVITGPDGEEVASVEGISLPQLSLWGALTGQRDPGRIVVERLVAKIVRGEDGTTNLQRALAGPAAPPAKPGAGAPLALLLGLELHDGQVELVGPTGTVLVRDLRLASAAEGGKILTATVAAGGVQAPLELTITPGVAQILLRAEGFPVALLDALAGAEGTLVAALGNEATFVANLETGEGGSLLFRADSPTTTIRVHGAGQSTLLLREDATVTMEVTPELGAKVLVAVNPFLLTAVGAAEPIRAKVLSSSFRLPLAPFDLAGVVADLEVEVGEVLIADGGPLDTLLEALGERSRPETLVTFGTVAIHLEGGVATYARSWLEAGKVAVALEGTVDLVADRLDLRLVIPKSTLVYLLGDMASGLALDYEFVVGITGTTQNPEIATAEIMAKLASLLAESVLGNPNALDGILDSLGGLFR
ncbi:hypothetical protein IIA16_04465 [bacterium]|nr:hypothetical protein [bacterium]